MIFWLFLTVIIAASWVTFWNERRQDDEPDPLTPDERARMDRILARVEAERRCLVGLDPMVVDEWVRYLEAHNHLLLIGRKDCAVAVPLPTPARVH